jgi:ABC-2 type transport system ATP-binding protein
MIKVRSLTKTFEAKGRSFPAVRGVDFDVAAGEIVGFLGPNGAGKTTTLRMLATLLRPSSGEALVAGCDLSADPAGVRRRIGYVGQEGSAGPDQRAAEEVTMQARIYGLSAREAKQRTADLLNEFDLGDAGTRLAGTLSGGQRRRLDIAMGIVHRPALLFLDEPSTGLDPQSRINLWDHIRALRDEHDTTVFLTTHYLDEVDVLCDRILVIDHGTIIAEGTPDELKQRVSGDLVVLVTDDSETTAQIAKKSEGASETAVDGAKVSFRVPRGDEVLPGLLLELDQAGVKVSSIQSHRPTLDDVFLTLTGRSLRDA